MSNRASFPFALLQASALAFLVAAATLACSSSNDRDAGRDAQAGAGPNAGANGGDAGSAPDPGGWVLVHGIHPPVVRRAEAGTCPEWLLDECRTDDDCGPGAACACGSELRVVYRNSCVPAECRSDADCGGRACLLSHGSAPDACCASGNRGLFCARDGDACEDGCPGNGIACSYSAANDRFECQSIYCTCN
jgi:hypothetical protein